MLKLWRARREEPGHYIRAFAALLLVWWNVGLDVEEAWRIELSYEQNKISDEHNLGIKLCQVVLLRCAQLYNITHDCLPV